MAEESPDDGEVINDGVGLKLGDGDAFALAGMPQGGELTVTFVYSYQSLRNPASVTITTRDNDSIESLIERLVAGIGALNLNVSALPRIDGVEIIGAMHGRTSVSSTDPGLVFPAPPTQVTYDVTGDELTIRWTGHEDVDRYYVLINNSIKSSGSNHFINIDLTIERNRIAIGRESVKNSTPFIQVIPVMNGVRGARVGLEALVDPENDD